MDARTRYLKIWHADRLLTKDEIAELGKLAKEICQVEGCEMIHDKRYVGDPEHGAPRQAVDLPKSMYNAVPRQ